MSNSYKQFKHNFLCSCCCCCCYFHIVALSLVVVRFNYIFPTGGAHNYHWYSKYDIISKRCAIITISTFIYSSFAVVALLFTFPKIFRLFSRNTQLPYCLLPLGYHLRKLHRQSIQFNYHLFCTTRDFFIFLFHFIDFDFFLCVYFNLSKFHEPNFNMSIVFLWLFSIIIFQHRRLTVEKEKQQ